MAIIQGERCEEGYHYEFEYLLDELLNIFKKNCRTTCSNPRLGIELRYQFAVGLKRVRDGKSLVHFIVSKGYARFIPCSVVWLALYVDF